MSDDGDIIPSVMQNGGNQYKIKENSFLPSAVPENNTTMSFENTKPAENYGPDQVLPASKKYTSEANGRVTLRIEAGADNTPISVPGLLTRSAEKYGDLPALNYKSDNNGSKLLIKNMNKMYELLLKHF